MTGALAVLGQSFQRLVDEGHVALVDVEAEEAQLARRRSADAVEERDRLRHEVVAALVGLREKKVLHVTVVILAEELEEAEDGQHDQHFAGQFVCWRWKRTGFASLFVDKIFQRRRFFPVVVGSFLFGVDGHCGADLVLRFAHLPIAHRNTLKAGRCPAGRPP